MKYKELYKEAARFKSNNSRSITVASSFSPVANSKASDELLSLSAKDDASNQSLSSVELKDHEVVGTLEHVVTSILTDSLTKEITLLQEQLKEATSTAAIALMREDEARRILQLKEREFLAMEQATTGSITKLLTDSHIMEQNLLSTIGSLETQIAANSKKSEEIEKFQHSELSRLSTAEASKLKLEKELNDVQIQLKNSLCLLQEANDEVSELKRERIQAARISLEHAANTDLELRYSADMARLRSSK